MDKYGVYRRKLVEMATWDNPMSWSL